MADPSPSSSAPVSLELRRRPPIAGALLRTLQSIDALFERIYGSRLNPLQQSGPLAVALLLLVVATGLWLLLFYRVGAPYASVVRITEQPVLVGWVRSLHRYASDACVVAIVLHVVRLLAEGRTYGPRVLAWLSGIVVVIMVLVCGWTGFVLVWDDQGRAVALGGARLLEAIPLLRDAISTAFLSTAPLAPSFYFMNLFLHVAMPLGMLLTMWLHTLRVSRVRWLPTSKLLWGVVGALLLLSVLVPASLGSAADATSLDGPGSLDLFYNGWLLLTRALPPWLGLALFILSFALLAVVPWLWRPGKAVRPPLSTNDKLRCTGCTQCTLDCPFGAISMIPRTVGEGSELVADVDPDLCTSCGLCAGSCEQLVIGPPDRAPRLQLQATKALRASAAADIVFAHCKNARFDVDEITAGIRSVPYALECTGSLHPAAVENLLHHFKGVFVASCPPDACQMREGPALTSARLIEGQRPARADKLHERVAVASMGGGETKALKRRLRTFARTLGIDVEPVGETSRWLRVVAAGVVSLVLGGGLALASMPSLTQPTDERASLRLLWGLPGQVQEHCRDLSQEELLALPVHMRQPRRCERTPVAFDLAVYVDGVLMLDRTVSPRGRRGDGPIVVNVELPVSTGEHDVEVRMVPKLEGPKPLHLRQSLRFVSRRAQVIGYDAVARALVPH